ncbi:hypothetical protein Pla108_18570 [Botrimarina colliarenosi]|uniref:Carboxypeptidase regulatory-like domain-containing protein n=1 Tax=Botrimarina colliarenosi TaxID=2528001 RepID=A0A5C6AEU4_9BACT|nr:carboxypeptidase-like regulatory domain-containing protein [Botrimarina colliarenosi]TWT97705.1 hypothetical protein Pla108_18570 [Botrimarina colliarenosi]
MSFRLAYGFLVLLLATGATADVIYLADGRTLRGEVTEYVNGVIRLHVVGGDDSVVALNLITRIEFAPAVPPDDQTLIIPPPPAYEEVLQALIEKTEERLKQKGADTREAAIVLYLDTGLGEPASHPENIDIRCYRGLGYSGGQRATADAPWLHFESVREREDGVRRLEIDPGPPYAVINRSVTLVPGKIANLGRIVLQKVKADGTVTLTGYVRDGAGVPVEGALVSADARRTHSDADGFYQLEGFGLEVVNLSVRKRGFVGGSSRVSIRDTEKKEIACDLSVFRPRRLKLSYVISAEGSDIFEGPGVETGTIERVVDSSRIPLDETIYSSASFQRFAKEAHLYLGVKDGAVTIGNSHAPIFYQLAEPEVRFADIKELGELPMSAQRCPPLSEGAVIVARGNHPQFGRGISPFCVKFLVEELSMAAGEFNEEEFAPVEGE